MDPKTTVLEELRAKTAFATNEFSGPMNPVIASGASYQGQGKVTPLFKPGQKVAFKLHGEMKHQGLDIAIENRKGSVRSGVTDDGKKWRTEMKHPYGYIRGTKGADGEDIDCYVGPKEDATHAHVVHQHKPDGTGYDEDKVMLGFGSKAEAREAYLKHYDDPKFLGPMKSVPMERLKALLSLDKKLEKISASAPTRGGFMMASDQNAGPITPLFKGSDMMPNDVTFSSSDFKPAKLTKKADISPTSPLGDGGGNPHRAASYQGRGPINPIFNPNVKQAEDGGGAEFGGQYMGQANAMTPVSNMGFKQTSMQGRGPINALFKKASSPAGLLASSARIGKTPGAMSMKGPSLHSLSGVAGGPSLPGSIKSGIGEYRGKMQT